MILLADPWKYFTPEPNTGCWLWTRGLTAKGYASFRGRHAHTVVLEETLGRPLKPGHGACHTCDCRPCGNPEHLWEGDNAANTQDMKAKGRARGAPGRAKANWGGATCHRGADHPNWRGGPEAAAERAREHDRRRPRSIPGTPEHAAKCAYMFAYRKARRANSCV